MKESKIFSEQNLTTKVHYVYRVTIDGKYYIGKRSGLLNDLITGRYKTSSKLVHEKLQNGLHFSKIKILQVFPTAKDALEFESRILTRVNAKANLKFLNQHNGSGDFTFKQHTEATKEKIKEYYNPETEQGRKNRDLRKNLSLKQFDKNTEEGRKQREIHSKVQRNRWNENTELGRKRREHISNKRKEYFNPNTEEGRRNRENHSEIMKEIAKVTSQKRAETQIQNRKNASILGELMFDEAFIREKFLISDDKNNQRFLHSVYSKLTGFSKSHISREKRKGKLSFLSGIKSIKLSEELENAKIQEIKAIIKSMNEK